MDVPVGQAALTPKSSLARAITLITVVVPFAATAWAIFTLWQRAVTWTDVILMGVMYFLSGIGVTVGFHRFATHRGFKTSPVVELVFFILGSMAVEGPVITWTADHWKHHKHSDRPGDPHSPTEGFIHAHIGWMFGTNHGIPEQDAKHLLKDRVAVFVNRTFVLWVAIGLFVPYLFDGWRGVLWGGLVRVFLLHHVTWSVNSICHQFGRRDYETPDQSGNQWLVGIIGLGEGWHNNHHAFPESAFHGLKWWQIDLSAYVIRGMERLGLISGVRRVSPERLAKKQITAEQRDQRVA